MNRLTFLLNGDELCHGLNKDLGFTDADRTENIHSVGEVAKLMTDAGLIVPGEFVEVFVDTPLLVPAERDVKGLNAKARLGQL